MTKIRLTNQTQGVLNLQGPEGFLINGKIVTSVSSGNLTVAIKTLAGTDPSTSDPVYCRIDGVVRSVTNALSVVINAGDNYFNAGSSELATKEIDYFVYLGYRAFEGDMQIGVSRVPYGITYNDFFGQPSEKRIIVTSQFGMGLTDKVVNIGRFNAILSGGAGYTWSIPATSVIINRPCFETRWLDWVSTTTPGGSMTYTGLTHNQKYKVIGNTVFLQSLIDGTTGGTSSNTISITLPFESVNAPYELFLPGMILDNLNAYSGSCYNDISKGTLRIRKYDQSNFSLGASRQIHTNGHYSI